MLRGRGLLLLPLPDVLLTSVVNIFRGLAPVALFGIYWKLSNIMIVYEKRNSNQTTPTQLTRKQSHTQGVDILALIYTTM